MCSGQDGASPRKEEMKRLRKSLSDKVDSVAPAESDPGVFSESELIGMADAIPTDFRDYASHPGEIRLELSRGIKDVNSQSEDPTQFTKSELEALENALDGVGIIPRETAIVITTAAGFIKRTPFTDFQVQRRGGKGMNHIELDEGDTVDSVSPINPRNQVYYFTDFGEVYALPGHEIPELGRKEPGVPLEDLLKLEEGEDVVDMFSVADMTTLAYIVTSTADGYIKRMSTDLFENILSTGIQAVDLEQSELVDASWSTGDDEVLLASAHGKSIRFEETQVRSMGRTAKGVAGIELRADDTLADTTVIASDFSGQVVTVTTNGFGKRTAIDEYQSQNRYGKGLKDIDTGERNGPVVSVDTITRDDNILVVTRNGRAIVVAADEISKIGRNTMGVNIIDLKDGDTAVSMTVVESE
jgi:DNA gyrase subunit A